MCYTLLLSTTSDKNLTTYNNDLVCFSKDLPQIAEVKELRFPNKWYVGSQSGCSCAFRHLYSIDLGFGDPVDWYKEEPEEIEATLQIIQIIRELILSDSDVDCIDAWERQEMLPVAKGKLVAGLSLVKNSEFRFFENHHFFFTR